MFSFITIGQLANVRTSENLHI